MMTHQECINCGTTYDIDEIVYFCRKCGDLLEVQYETGELEKAARKSEWRKPATFGMAIQRFHAHQKLFENSLSERRRNRTSSLPPSGGEAGAQTTLREE